METTTTTTTTTTMTLLEHFTKGQQLFEELEKTSISYGDPSYKELVMNTIRCFQTCAFMISQNSLFSENEELTEFSNASIKYLSVPYYLGELYQKIPSTQDPNQRLPHLKQAKNFFDKFISKSISLGILNKTEANAHRTEAVADPETKRNNKIRRYKREKEIQQKLDDLLKQKMSKGITDEEEVEDESDNFERQVSILLVENHTIKAIDSLSSLKQEIEIVEHMVKLMQQNGGKLPEPPNPIPSSKPPSKPIVITDSRQWIKDNAFKPGWNQPTITLEQAAEYDYQDMLKREARNKEAERKKSAKLVKEFGDDDNEAEELKKQRDFDEFKDDHKRGSGNTGNKGYQY